MKSVKAVHYSGHIVDGATGEPVDAARITLIPSRCASVWRTDSNGRFSFWVASEDNQRIDIEHDGYQPLLFVVKRGSLDDMRLSPSPRVAQPSAYGELIPPSQAVAPAILTADSEPKLSGMGRHWSPWYLLSVGKAPQGYAVQRVEFWLSGDRSCGTGAECRELARDNKQIVWEFRLQGHDETGAPARTFSAAHIQVLYRAE